MRYAKIIGIVLVFIFISSIFGLSSQRGEAIDATSPRVIAELGQASTVLIATEFNGTVAVPQPNAFGEATSQNINIEANITFLGSGFFVSSDGYIITAGHVVGAVTSDNYTQDELIREELANSAAGNYLNQGGTFSSMDQTQLQSYILENGDFGGINRSVYAVLGEVPHTLTDIRSRGWLANVTQASPSVQYDIALLKVDGYDNCPVLLIGNSSEVMMGDQVFVFGFPALATFNINTLQGQGTTLAPSMTSGQIGGIRQTDNGTPVFQTDAAFTHGSSGGPGLNQTGKVIGVAVSGSADPDSGQQLSGFNFMVQSVAVTWVMNNNSVNNTQGAVDQHFMQGLMYYYDKHYSAAMKEFQTVVALFAPHWRAQALIESCREAIDQGKDVPLANNTTAAVGGLAVA